MDRAMTTTTTEIVFWTEPGRCANVVKRNGRIVSVTEIDPETGAEIGEISLTVVAHLNCGVKYCGTRADFLIILAMYYRGYSETGDEMPILKVLDYAVPFVGHADVVALCAALIRLTHDASDRNVVSAIGAVIATDFADEAIAALKEAAMTAATTTGDIGILALLSKD